MSMGSKFGMQNAMWTSALLAVAAFCHGAAANPIEGPFTPGSGNWTLLPNGGFDVGGLSGWQNYDPEGKGNFVHTTTAAFEGSGAVRAEPSEDFTLSGFALYRDVSVTPGQTYALSGFFQTGALESGALYLDTNDSPFEVQVGAFTQVEQWQFAWGEVTIPTNVSSVRIRLVRDGTVFAGQIGFIDEVALTPIESFSPPTRLGDLNGDGCVDLSDLATLLSDFGCQSNCAGDTTGDDDTDLADLAEILANFGQGC